MKSIRNEYRELKKENDLIFSTLAECDRDTITEIISVADNTCGIGYEIELIRKDLIAMAAQAEARHDYLPSVCWQACPSRSLRITWQTALCGCARLR